MVGILGVIVGALVVRMTGRVTTGNPVTSTSMSSVPLLGSSHHEHHVHHQHHHDHDEKSTDPSSFSLSKRVVEKGNWIETFSLTRGVLVTSASGEQTLYGAGQSSYNGTDMVGGNDIGAQFAACLAFISETLQDA
eukprot:scaffold5640_cov76-Amphora_coffeaeformis.AAC.1